MEFDTDRFQIIDHPLVQHKLHILRDKDTSTKDFRELVTELAVFEGYEALRDLPLEDVQVETPLETASALRAKRSPSSRSCALAWVWSTAS